MQSDRLPTVHDESAGMKGWKDHEIWNDVDMILKSLQKRWNMSTLSCLQSSILIQPRTSLWKVKTAPQEGPNGDIRNGDGNMNVYWE